MAFRALRSWGLPGLTVLMLTLAPLSAAAQDWSISMDLPTGDGAKFLLTFKDGGSNTQQQAEVENIGTEGVMLNVTTPFHVGFGVESYRVRLLPEPGDTKFVLDFDVQMLDVYVEVPVTSWLFFAPGAGWGKATFKLEGSGGSDFHAPEDVNLWQWYAVLGVRLPWSLQARLGYHEVRGKLVNRESAGNAETQEMRLSLTTLGIGYTF